MISTMGEIVLDHIDSISYDPQDPPLANPHALNYLFLGLHSLAQFVRKQEVVIIERYKKQGKNPPTFIAFSKTEYDPLLHCIFNWYATDLINYFRLIGLIDGLQTHHLKYKEVVQDKDIRKKLNKHCTDYIKKVHQELYLWRNKVSAHFAMTHPREEDNLATLESSVMFPVSYQRPYFEAGGFKWTIGEDQSQLPDWKLTKVFEDLAPRFWPESKLPNFPCKYE